MLKRIIEVWMVIIVAFSFVFVPIVVQAAVPAPTAFSNGSFEEVDSTTGIPKAWVEYSWLIATKPSVAATTFTVMTDGNGKDGKNYMKIANVVSDDSRLVYAIKIKPAEKYKVTCWVKTENIGTTRAGANISVVANMTISKDLKGTNDWTLLEYYFESTNSERADITIGIGSYGRDNTGIAYIDDVKVEKIDAFPSDVVIAKVTDPTIVSGSTGNTNGTTSNSTTTIIIVIVVVLGIVATIIFSNNNKKKKASTESIEDEENPDKELDEVDEVDELDEVDEVDELGQPKKSKLKDDDDDDDDTSL
jgi:dolichyl-phosphate-mannose-protein mannosyltransferase